ncbi:MAG: glycosyl hydrolase [Flavobacteriales bacterium]|nr:glycosyl hydrolase [Flavobacteriales bacterium]|tara:strand:+ start:2265 stop:5495 length:3231 start_codon:yes stop_codon:yes gene_type:complete
MFRRILPLLIITLLSLQIKAQNISDTSLSGLKFRSIGPAFMSGRIADIAIHPENDNTWYIAVGSGGVWRTLNSGVTWEPLFDDQKVYSTGCVTIDPNQPTTIWVGTGENVGGRHISWGDGIYKSTDGGKSWKNMGLTKSERISKIIVHPENSNIVFVAVQGPLWSKGGERGFYMTTDGGKTWKKTLGNEEWTGVTDIAIDHTNPDVLYAATWDRHRTVAAYMGGGPGTGLHKSTDGGKTWTQLKSGLPKGNLGKIGLAISPQKNNVLYAAIELDRRSGAVYRSEDYGVSWKKMSETVSGATGPHYYQELYASPHQFDRLYLMDVRAQVSEDGGKTFNRMPEEHKHSDNHAMAFRKDDPNYLLFGCDGGVYESFDLGQNWRFMANLPLTQYYKVAVDDAEPFYNIYGGTQDNNTQGGPSRTDNVHGIMNSDWYVVLFGDGHQPATEPGNPDIVYAEWQQGNLTRVDKTTGEIVYIQPQPAEGDPVERFNWDAPILVSPHDPKTIYFASQRVWKSTNRGDSWTAVSGDLTKDLERIELPIMGKKQSWDNPWDIYAMSNYSTITSLAESPIKKGLLYAGTDDGLIQISENDGDSWKKIPVSALGAPATAFVNDIKADLYDANTVYVSLDNHKYGDFKPYFYKSTDKGKSWKKLTNGLPERTLVWRMVQDHEKKELMFLATEFGIYATFNAANKWHQLKGGLPTISFRDLAIQKRENDLVGASFGRSFYVLDDYSALREVSEETFKEEGHLFPIRDAWWYIPRPVLSFGGKGSQGADHYVAPNPDFGAIITYYLAEDYKSLTEQRKETEKAKKDEDIPFPGWEELEKEKLEQKPEVYVVIKDLEGNVVRRIEASNKKGIHRVAWDLRYPYTDAIRNTKLPKDPDDLPKGLMAAPGDYTATLIKLIDGVSTELSAPQKFTVKRLKKGALEGSSTDAVAAFWRELEDINLQLSGTNVVMNDAREKLERMAIALNRSRSNPGELDKQLHELQSKLSLLNKQLNGDPLRNEVGEKYQPTIGRRVGVASMGTTNSTYGPSQMHKESLAIAQKQYKALKADLDKIVNEEIPALEEALIKAKAPYVR